LKNLVEKLKNHADSQADATAIWSAQLEVSYFQLHEAVTQIAGWIRVQQQEETLRQETLRIGVLGSKNAYSIMAILSCAWAGCTYVPLSAKLPVDRLNSFLERANLHGIIVDPENENLLEELSTVPNSVLKLSAVDSSTTTFRRVVGDNYLDTPQLEHPKAVQPDDLAYIMFTSGTTGIPKGVMVTCSNVFAFLSEVNSRYHVTSLDRVSQFFELTFDLSVFDIFFTLNAGASLCMVPEKHRMAPGAFIRKQKITFWFSVPSTVAMMKKLNQLKPGSFPDLKTSLFCGEPLPSDLALHWRESAPNSTIDNHYGPTEATISCLLEPCTESVYTTPNRTWASIGTPFQNMRAACVSVDKEFLPPGEAGELVLSGDQIAAGYWLDPEKTDAQFVILNHPELGEGRWYLTGDLATQSSDGKFHYLGRADNQIKLRGNRIELEDIESNLRIVCNSEHVACVGWPVVDGVASGLTAFVADVELDAEAIIGGLAKRVPQYMVPDDLMRIEKIPLTTNGKLDRKALVSLLEKSL